MASSRVAVACAVVLAALVAVMLLADSAQSATAGDDEFALDAAAFDEATGGNTIHGQGDRKDKAGDDDVRRKKDKGDRDSNKGDKGDSNKGDYKGDSKKKYRTPKNVKKSARDDDAAAFAADPPLAADATDAGASDAAKQSQQQAAAAAAMRQAIAPINPYLELLYITTLLAYLTNYAVGRYSNSRIVSAFTTAFRPFLETNFASVDASTAFEREANHVYRLQASGRRNCLGAQFTLELQKRQEGISRLLTSFYTIRDRLIFDVPMDRMEPFVFAIVRKSHEKTYRKDCSDLNEYANKLPAPALPGSLVALAESTELVEDLLMGEVATVLRACEPLVQRIHFTDSSPFTVHPKLLRFEFFLPDADDTGKLRSLLKMAFFLVDFVAEYQLSRYTKAKTLEARARVQEVQRKAGLKEKKEEEQRKREEQKAAERERLAARNPEALRRLEEKERRRSMKKKMGQRVKMVVG